MTNIPVTAVSDHLAPSAITDRSAERVMSRGLGVGLATLGETEQVPPRRQMQNIANIPLGEQRPQILGLLTDPRIVTKLYLRFLKLLPDPSGWSGVHTVSQG